MNYGKKTAKRILRVARVIEIVFLLAVVVLLVASTLLIANTIRLSIFSRRREIEVMKLVGATNWFVRGPFMLEGLICGLAGSVRRRSSCSCSARRSRCRRSSATSATRATRTRSTFAWTALILLGFGVLLGAGRLGRHDPPASCASDRAAFRAGHRARRDAESLETCGRTLPNGV